MQGSNIQQESKPIQIIKYSLKEMYEGFKDLKIIANIPKLAMRERENVYIDLYCDNFKIFKTGEHFFY